MDDHVFTQFATGLRQRLLVMLGDVVVAVTPVNNAPYQIRKVSLVIYRAVEQKTFLIISGPRTWMEDIDGIGSGIHFSEFTISLMPTDSQLRDQESINRTIEMTAQRVMERWAEYRLTTVRKQISTAVHERFYILDGDGLRTRDSDDEEFLCASLQEAHRVVSYYFEAEYGKTFTIVNKDSGEEEVIHAPDDKSDEDEDDGSDN